MCSKRTVQSYLKQEGYKYKSVQRNIKLLSDDRRKKVTCVTEWITENHEWEKTVFIDEKVFSLDGPVNWKTYIHEKEEEVRELRVCGGGKFMAWLMVLPNGLICFEIFRSTFRSNDYQQLLENQMLKVIHLNMKDFFDRLSHKSIVFDCLTVIYCSLI